MLGLLGAIVLAGVVFAAGGGNTLAPNTWVQGGLLVLAASVAIAAVLLAARGRAWGAGALLGFAALAALTYASIAWSVQPANSWLEGNRTLSYFAAFAATLLLARLAPDRWRSLLGAVAVAATLACAYSLLVKVFPGTLDASDPVGRLRAPFAYWNAVGLLAALGLPACLWAGARDERAPVLRALAVPALAILVAALVLSFSRGAVVVAVIGLGIWFSLAPLRLRSTAVLLTGALGGGAIAAWATAHRGISGDGVSITARISAGHSFGLVIVLVLVLAAIAGVGVRLGLDRATLRPSLRRRVGAVLIGLVALVPVGGVVALAHSSRGLTGEVTHLWHNLTNANGGVGNQPGRLVQLSNTRPHYWSIAIRMGEHHPLAGVGAAGFGTAEGLYGAAASYSRAQHAHGYVVETFADLGAIGLAINLVLLVAWLIAAARTLEYQWRRAGSPPPADPIPETGGERAGGIAMLAIAVTFGAHSLIDWTWFVPGVAVPALACAGWLAGRGPLSSRAGRASPRRALLRSPILAATAGAITVLTLAGVFVIAQPLRSSDSYSAAITEALRGDAAAAFSDARNAASENPVSVDPLFLLSRLYDGVGESAAARQELTRAVSIQPSNPQSWQQLGCFDRGHHRVALGLREMRRGEVLESGQSWVSQNEFCAASL